MYKNFSFLLILIAFSGVTYADSEVNTNQTESILWKNYYKNTINAAEPHTTLLLACKYFQMENIYNGKAADLGAGTGRDTLFLLNSGWKVLALDAEPLSIEIILNRVDQKQISDLEVLISPFADMEIPKDLNLINASFSLPFCKPEDFDHCWNTIVSSLVVGGRFSGQFFGIHDEWANNPNLTIHTYKDLIAQFNNEFIIEYLQIEDELIPCANGQLKHWHIYHVVAKKISHKS